MRNDLEQAALSSGAGAAIWFAFVYVLTALLFLVGITISTISAIFVLCASGALALFFTDRIAPQALWKTALGMLVVICAPMIGRRGDPGHQH